MFNVNGSKFNIHSFYTSKNFQVSSQQDKDDHYKFCVVRDPIRRLLSCYSNRVNYHHELNEENLVPDAIDAGLMYNPSLSFFISNLEGYRHFSPSIKHHTDPLTTFLGKDPGYYDKIYKIQDMDVLKQDIEKRIGKAVNIPREQAEGDKIDPGVLSSKEKDIIRKFYEEDYDIFNLFF